MEGWIVGDGVNMGKIVLIFIVCLNENIVICFSVIDIY